jgi:flagellar biosynthesis/type III secretory pathway protein FliH
LSQTQPFNFEALDGEARLSVRSSAASRAEEIVMRARSEAAAILQAAREQGYAEGHFEGLETAQAGLQPGKETLAAIGTALVTEHELLVARTEKAAVELALALADKVVAAALDVRPELVLEVVTGALRRVADRSSIVLEVNPADYEMVGASIDEIAAGFGGFAALEVVPERRVGRGGCTVRTPDGEIGACIDEQLSRAAELIRELLRA